jgi:hypothetical protein
MAGGHDPGRIALDDTGAAYELNAMGEPIALPPRNSQAEPTAAEPQTGPSPASGPWGPRQ